MASGSVKKMGKGTGKIGVVVINPYQVLFDLDSKPESSEGSTRNALLLSALGIDNPEDYDLVVSLGYSQEVGEVINVPKSNTRSSLVILRTLEKPGKDKELAKMVMDHIFGQGGMIELLKSSVGDGGTLDLGYLGPAGAFDGSDLEIGKSLSDENKLPKWYYHLITSRFRAMGGNGPAEKKGARGVAVLKIGKVVRELSADIFRGADKGEIPKPLDRVYELSRAWMDTLSRLGDDYYPRHPLFEASEIPVKTIPRKGGWVAVIGGVQGMENWEDANDLAEAMRKIVDKMDKGVAAKSLSDVRGVTFRGSIRVSFNERITVGMVVPQYQSSIDRIWIDVSKEEADSEGKTVVVVMPHFVVIEDLVEKTLKVKLKVSLSVIHALKSVSPWVDSVHLEIGYPECGRRLFSEYVKPERSIVERYSEIVPKWFRISSIGSDLGCREGNDYVSVTFSRGGAPDAGPSGSVGLFLDFFLTNSKGTKEPSPLARVGAREEEGRVVPVAEITGDPEEVSRVLRWWPEVGGGDHKNQNPLSAVLSVRIDGYPDGENMGNLGHALKGLYEMSHEWMFQFCIRGGLVPGRDSGPLGVPMDTTTLARAVAYMTALNLHLVEGYTYNENINKGDYCRVLKYKDFLSWLTEAISNMTNREIDNFLKEGSDIEFRRRIYIAETKKEGITPYSIVTSEPELLIRLKKRLNSGWFILVGTGK